MALNLKKALYYRILTLPYITCTATEAASMIDNYVGFEQYFGSKNEPVQTFNPDIQDKKTHLNAVSLSSLFNLAAWTDGLQNQQGQKLNVSAGFLESMIPNAVAERDSTSFYIGINNALFVTINEFAMFCFAQKQFFPDIGENHLEKSPQPLNGYAPGLWLLQYTKSGGKVTDAQSHHLIPKCSIRYMQSIYLAQLMARFVWLHELAHCNNGHVSFIQHQKIANGIHELNDGLHAAALSKPNAKRNLRILRLLEFDADGSAMKASLRIQTDSLENIDGIANQPLEVRVDLALFAAYAMTWLFEEIQAYLDVRAGLTHPSPFDRLQNLFRITTVHLSNHIPDIEERREKAFKRFDTVRDAIPKIFCTQNIQMGIENEHEKQRAKRLASDLISIRAQLEPFAFF